MPSTTCSTQTKARQTDKCHVGNTDNCQPHDWPVALGAAALAADLRLDCEDKPRKCGSTLDTSRAGPVAPLMPSLLSQCFRASEEVFSTILSSVYYPTF